MTPIILSGGSGSRLWPVSRQAFPKQFCSFLDESLFVKALKRVQPLGSPWTVTTSELKVLSEKSMRELGIPVGQVMYEPYGRNTAPAIALLCRVFELRGLSDEVVGVFPADQLIEDDEAFRAAVRRAEKFAAAGHVVTLGVAPTFPATGYGYIETNGELEPGVMRAIGFREKPNESTACEFISRGGFYWNAGMFIFKVSKMIEQLSQYAPDVWKAFEGLAGDLENLESIYESVRAISIDYAVMERMTEHVCVPCSFEWSDLGSWDAVAKVLGRTGVKTEMVEVEGRDNFVFPNGNKAYAFVGVGDLIVVDTSDALLITRRGASERVKDVVDQFKNRANPVATQNTFEVRPWGRFDVVKEGLNFKSKSIIVDPGQQLSYQSHAKREEHWIVVKGVGEVVLNDKVIPMKAGQHVHIPIGARHRMRNTGAEILEFVEVQLGTYFGESDIVRYEDDYKRVT